MMIDIQELPPGGPALVIASAILAAQADRLDRVNADVTYELGRYEHSRALIGDLITRLIDELDVIDGEVDLEDAELGDVAVIEARLGYGFNERTGLGLEDDEDGGDAEPMFGAIERYPNPPGWGEGRVSQEALGRSFFTAAWSDELEEENEHGGDILDVPHDESDGTVDDEDGGDLEVDHAEAGICDYDALNLYAQETPGLLVYDGRGGHEAREQLRRRGLS